MPRPRDFFLLVDIGNTFLKWGFFRPTSKNSAMQARIDSSHALLEEASALAAQFTRFNAPARIVISNVAGTRMRATMIRLLEVWPDAPAPYWLIPQEEQCDVVNRYRNPAQLGSDRWAALIGTRRVLGAKPAMVVVCGTATTIDFLTAKGEFSGGMIMPGMGLMLRSLHEGTAALPDADGDVIRYPTQTVDAIVSGCMTAQAGAIERVYAREVKDTPDLVCVLSGGAARAVVPRLTIPVTLHDNLVLEGLYRVCQSLPVEGAAARPSND